MYPPENVVHQKKVLISAVLNKQGYIAYLIRAVAWQVTLRGTVLVIDSRISVFSLI